MKKIAFLASCLLAAGASTSASAIMFTSVPYGFDAYAPGSTVISFDAPLPAGFTLTGGTIQSGTNSQHAAPGVFPGVPETSNYLSANPGDSATITATTGYRDLSIYWGSIDSYNTITFLDNLGGAIASFTGSQIVAAANGDQIADTMNRRVYFTAEPSDSAIYGVRFASSSPAFETDNLAFSSAVPEPATWAMLIFGFGVAGVQLRSRTGKRRLATA